jgi:hypothetical protein
MIEAKLPLPLSDGLTVAAEWGESNPQDSGREVMIRHIVLVRFKHSVTAAAKAAHYAGLEALKGHLKGIAGSQFGPNISPEEPVIHGFKDGFWFDFVDEAARDAYLVDPAHQAAGAKLVADAEGGVDGLVVFDMKV